MQNTVEEFKCLTKVAEQQRQKQSQKQILWEFNKFRAYLHFSLQHIIEMQPSLF